MIFIVFFLSLTLDPGFNIFSSSLGFCNWSFGISPLFDMFYVGHGCMHVGVCMHMEGRGWYGAFHCHCLARTLIWTQILLTQLVWLATYRGDSLCLPSSHWVATNCPKSQHGCWKPDRGQISPLCLSVLSCLSALLSPQGTTNLPLSDTFDVS